MSENLVNGTHVFVPHVEGVDPAITTQIATLSVQIAAALAAKQYGQAVILGIQIAGLIATMFAPTPTK
jgi:hypothetical protein